DRRLALRLWPAPVQLRPGHEPLWIGTAQTLHFSPAVFDVLATWRPRADADPALEQVREAVADLPHRIEPHPVSGVPTLRLRTSGAGGGAEETEETEDQARYGRASGHARPRPGDNAVPALSGDAHAQPSRQDPGHSLCPRRSRARPRTSLRTRLP